MKSQKGFIQIPFLIAIIAGVLVLGSGGYFGVKRYQSYQTEKIEKEKQAQEQAEAQQKALELTQTEIEKLKQENVAAKEKQKELEKKIGTEQSASKDSSISSKEIAPYLSAVVNIFCSDGTKRTGGSGFFWKWDNQFAILTNDHVIILTPQETCLAKWPYDETNVANRKTEFGEPAGDTGDFFWIYSQGGYDWNKKTDVHVSLIWNKEKSLAGFPVASANYSLYSLRRCSIRMPLGSPVVLIGFPAFTQTDTNAPRTITNGVISGHDQSVSPPQGVLPGVDYFVSNKIDSGNSGGVALSKDINGLCLLGVPTWLSLGNFETQGVVQNIHNVTHRE